MRCSLDKAVLLKPRIFAPTERASSIQYSESFCRLWSMKREKWGTGGMVSISSSTWNSDTVLYSGAFVGQIKRNGTTGDVVTTNGY